MGLTVTEALQLIQAGGVLGLLVLILITGWRQDWVWAKVRDAEQKVASERLEEMRVDRNEWKSAAQAATATVTNLTGQVEQLTNVVEKLTGTLAPRAVAQ